MYMCWSPGKLEAGDPLNHNVVKVMGLKSVIGPMQ